jgi:hypothetical protein
VPSGAFDRKEFIVKTAYAIASNRPAPGPVALACVAAFQPAGMRRAAAWPSVHASDRGADRNEGRWHPGEGCA